MYLLSARWSARHDSRGRGVKDGWWKPGHDGGFTPVTVPNAFNASSRSAAGFRAGIHWYRVRFTLPDDPHASAWRIRFEGIGRRALVFLNGRYLGARGGAWLPSEIGARGIRQGDNELVIRVDGRARHSDLPPGDRLAGWWNYAGLLREVYLRRVGPLDLSDVQVTTHQSAGTARVDVRAVARNTTRTTRGARFESVLLTGPQDAAPRDTGAERAAVSVPAGARASLHTTFTIRDPQRWSPEHPSLYELQLALPGGQRTTVHFGVREWRRTRDGRVLLNGKPVLLRGASFHEQAAGHGAALTPLDRANLVTQLGSLGADFARAHYPPHPALLDAFDRLGIVYWAEVPVWRLRGEQLADGHAARALAMLGDMIRRDRNHASVMVWGAENETLRGGAAESSYLRKARALVRRLDPTRFLGAEAPISPLSQLGAALREVDALGFNEYLGWYGGHVSDIRRSFAAARAKFPGQAAFITEFGAEGSRPGPASHKGTFAFQKDFLARQLNALGRLRGVNGKLVWLLRDFVARPGWSGGDPHPRPPSSAKGLLHADGKPKPAFATVHDAFGPRVARAGGAR
jgi:beta-glucuronidase